MAKKKKKQSVLGKLSSKLKTTRGKVALTFVVFALLGGAIFVYTSFASLYGGPWNYTLATGNLSGFQEGNCSQSATYDAQFKTGVATLVCPGNAQGKAFTNTVGSWLPKEYRAGHQVRFCSYVKGSSQKMYTIIIAKNQQYYGGRVTTYAEKTPFTTLNSSSYKYFCTPYLTLRDGYNGNNLRGEVVVEGTVPGSIVNVGGSVLELRWR